MKAAELVVAERTRQGIQSEMEVSHPRYGAFRTRAFSALDAALQAAVEWRADWMDVKKNAKVQLIGDLNQI